MVEAEVDVIRDVEAEWVELGHGVAVDLEIGDQVEELHRLLDRLACGDGRGGGFCIQAAEEVAP